MKRRTSIVDIAEKAGVSPASVSRVLNKKKTSMHISDATSQRVLKAARELDYTPNILARNFQSQKSNTVALLVTDTIDLCISSLISAAEKVLQDSGYTCLISNIIDCNKQKDFCVAAFKENRIDGVIITSFKIPLEESLFNDLAKNNVPFVLVGGSWPDKKITFINADNIFGGKAITEHLLQLGHQRILYIDCGYPDSTLRMEGYHQALADAGITPDASLVIQSDLGVLGGYKAINHYLKKATLPTAIFCCDDKVAFGVLRALNEAGISVPSECSIAGFDDIEFSQYSSPSLTTIAQPSAGMGKKGAMLIISKLKNVNQRPQHITLPTTLVIRESTCSVHVKKKFNVNKAV
ncbi:MAG: LacI family DNA-binding transcriptional regulator [Sedimentisphaerales bacterium]|nr:LacI family DNA-binding transcriptional regulator [Sedimentisphaerales bacterium]